MCNVPPLEPEENSPGNGPSAVLYVFPWKGLRIPTSHVNVSEAPTSATRDGGAADQVDRQEMTSLEQQFEQMESMARRHYPDDENERNACMVRLLKERLRTYHYRLQPLPVRQMTEEEK